MCQLHMLPLHGLQCVCVPPPHAMVANHHHGQWYNDLPPHCVDKWHCYDNALYQALTVSSSNLGKSELTKAIVYETSECQMTWCLAHVASHPALIEPCSFDNLPVQQNET